MYQTYLDCLNHYQKRYGPNTAVLMQVGKFYELYGLELGGVVEGVTGPVSRLLNLIRTRRDSNYPHARDNPYMVGFPTASLERYLRLLIQAHWTVIVIDQVAGEEGGGISQDKRDNSAGVDPAVAAILAAHAGKRGGKNVVARAVRAIYSPATYLENVVASGENNYLLAIHFEGECRSWVSVAGGQGEKDGRGAVNALSQLLTAGLCAVDLSTGQIWVYEVASLREDPHLALDEAYRFLSTFRSEEVVLARRGVQWEARDIARYLDLSERGQTHWLDPVPREIYQVAYQEALLKKVWPQESGPLSPIEWCGLARQPGALVALVMALQFAYEHDEKLIGQLGQPQFWESERHLVLASNCIQQLDLVGGEGGGNDGGIPRHLRSVCAFMDRTVTGLGRRLLRERLLHPVIAVDTLNQRYALTRAFTVSVSPKRVRQILQAVTGDLERLHRKMSLGTLAPMEWNILDQGYEAVETLYHELSTCVELQTWLAETVGEQFLTLLREWRAQYLAVLDLSCTSQYTLEGIAGTIFRRGYSAEIDRLQEAITRDLAYAETLVQAFSQRIAPRKKSGATAPVVVLRQTDQSGYVLSLTAPRLRTLQISLAKSPLKVGELTVGADDLIIGRGGGPSDLVDSPESGEGDVARTMAGGVAGAETGATGLLKGQQTVTTCGLQRASRRLLAHTGQLVALVTEAYRRFLAESSERIGANGIRAAIHRLVAQADLYQSLAEVVHEGYCLPQAVENPTRAWLQATGLRHPLAEHLNEATHYVAHDVTLGIIGAGGQKEGKEAGTAAALFSGRQIDGLLVYGLNGAGKSLLMQAVGVAIILAQAGMPVPAAALVFSPYRYVLTRILGNDNKFKGLSSFAVEMTELNGILSRITPRSLVLGDEICHGTETLSGLGIVAATVVTLADCPANFIFATHLHQLATMEAIVSRVNVGVCHLAVEIDAAHHRLVYRRQLLEGSGPSLYGVEVARAMGLPRAFVRLANRFRQDFLEAGAELLATHHSRYHSGVFMDRCAVCGARAEETHHIAAQSLADGCGRIEGVGHKDRKVNLVTLCQRCHGQVHRPVAGQARLVIEGWSTASGGQPGDLRYHYTTSAPAEERLVPVNVATPRPRLTITRR